MKKIFLFLTLGCLLINTVAKIHAMQEAIGEAIPESDVSVSPGVSQRLPIEHEPKAHSSILIFSENPHLNLDSIVLGHDDVQKTPDDYIGVRLDINKLAPLFKRLLRESRNKFLNAQSDNNTIPELIKKILVKNGKKYYNAGIEIPTTISFMCSGNNKGSQVEHFFLLKPKHFRKNDENKTQVILDIKKLSPIIASILRDQQISDKLLKSEGDDFQYKLPAEIKCALEENNLLYRNAGRVILQACNHTQIFDSPEAQSFIGRHTKTILSSAVLTTAVACTAAGYYFGNKH